MKILSKILVAILFLLSSFYFLSSPGFASAASQTIPAQINTAAPTSNTTPDVPNNSHFSTQSTVIEIMSAITCQLSGIDPINPKQPCLGIDQITGKIGFLPKTGLPDEALAKSGGAIGAMGNMITMLYTPPLHTSDYFQNLAQNFGITKRAFAQQTGTGFDGLKPLQGLWTAFRNIVYLVFVIVFVVIGLAIMLRIKIDPRTVMTIQNQIPKIIVGILLVTFSYAISGFLIDMMYTTIYITGNVIASAETTPKMDNSIVADVASSSSPFDAAERSVGLGAAWAASWGIESNIADLLTTTGGFVFSSIVGGVAGEFIIPAFNGTVKNINTKALSRLASFRSNTGKVWNLKSLAVNTGLLMKNFTANLVQTLNKKLPTALQSLPGGSLIGTIIGSFTAGAAVGMLTMKFIIPALASLIIFLILSIALFVALFRLWFALLIAYVEILLAVVLAPFWIIGGIIPGSSISISGWLKNIGANLLAFPVVIAMFLLGKVFQDAMGNGTTTNFVPPLIGDRLSPDAIKGFISLGIILITPNIINMLKTALKVPKIDTGLAKSAAVGVGLLMGTAKGVVGMHEASKEVMITGVKEGAPTYGARGQLRSFFGRFGR